MKKICFFLSLSICSFTQSVEQQYAQTISKEDLRKHLSIIAADDMEGRETGTAGQKKAADYILGQFFQMGLDPVVPTENGNKSYYQYYGLFKKNLWGNVLVKNTADSNKKWTLFKDYFPQGVFSVPNTLQVPLVFVGFGIDADTYSDYLGVDVKGKAVVFFDGEPQDKSGVWASTRTMSSSEWTGSTGIQKKINKAKENGAVAAFIIENPKNSPNAENFETQARKRRAMLARYEEITYVPARHPSTNQFATFFISKQMAKNLLNVKAKKLKRLQKKIEKALVPQSDTIEQGQVALKVERINEPIEAENVLAVIKGSEKPEEYVFVTSHYDHIGISPNGEINNGADDDGSGTCAVLEIAEAFMKAKAAGNGPKRSIVFMTVSGEEKGLLGSEYYTDKQPIIPLSNIVADLNIDMIGRKDDRHSTDQYVYLIGSDKLSSELHSISEKANKDHIGFELDYTYNDTSDPNRFYYRSDHYNFAKNKIPVIFYFSGVHEDYHKPTDDIEKIRFDKYESTTKLIFYTAWELANRPERIKVDSNKK